MQDEISDDQLTKHSIVGVEIRLWCDVSLPGLRGTSRISFIGNCDNGDAGDGCARRFGQHDVEHDVTSRRYDVPWLVLNAARARRNWDWRPAFSVEQILEEIAAHAEAHPEWLEISGHA
jgi:hypothetical protein